MSKVIPPASATTGVVTMNVNLVAPLVPSFADPTIKCTRCSFAMLAPPTLETLTKKFSLGSTVVSPLTVTSNEYVCAPAGIT